MFHFIAKKLFWGLFRHFLSDKNYARVRYKLERGFFPDLENPERLTEKIQQLKLFDRNPLRQQAADRIKMREYVQEKVSSEYLIPVLGVYNTLEKYDWDRLPDQFILKANHGCGFVKIIRDKASENFEDIKQLTKEWQNQDYSKLGREWVYKDLPRSIIAEELLLSDSGEIPHDFKFTCIHGRVEFVQVDVGRFNNQKRNLYDREFNQLDVKLLYPQYEGEIEQPAQWDDAVQLSEKLASDFDFIRVDLYLVHDKIFVGELTNFPGSGFIGFDPDEFDKKIGRKLSLSLQEKLH
jgi:hypothetical protein